MDIHPSAKDSFVGDHKRIIGFGSHSHDAVIPSTTVDTDRRVDVVFKEIIAAATVDDRFVFTHKRADQERIIPSFALQSQTGCVAEHSKRVVTFGSVGNQRHRDTVA